VEELIGAVVRAAWVRGNGIELVRELQWKVGVLAEHWVERVGRRRRLMTAGRSSGGVVATVVKWRRSRGGEMQPRERVNEVEEDSRTCCENKEGTGELKQLLAARRRAWRPQVPAARRGGAGRGQRGLHGRRAGELRATWCGKGGAGAAGGSGKRPAGDG
jgi:hypothetical protein